MQVFTGIYNELAEIMETDQVMLIYKNLRGQQVTFPKKLYTQDYVMEQVMSEYDGKNLKKLAVKYDYTERHLRKLMKEIETESQLDEDGDD